MVDSRAIDSRVVERTLLEARTALVAPPGARARVRARLQAGGAFAEASRALQAPRGSGGLVRTFGVARSTVAVLVGLGFGAGYWLGMQHPQPVERAATREVEVAPVAVAPEHVSPDGAQAMARPPSSDDRAEPPQPAAPEAVDPLAPRPSPAASAAEKPARRAHRAVHSPRARENTAELALLQRTERALRAGEAELALSFVNELEQRYPESPFREERSAARIMAECALGRPGAAERAQRFLHERPASVYSDRVHQKCTTESADGFREPGH